MPTPKSPSTKPKRAKAETQRQFEEIREEVTLAKALAHIERIAMEQANTRVQP